MDKRKIFLLFIFIAQPVFASYICDDTTMHYYAIYEANSYTCPSGEFLPSDAITCVACPSGFTCTGGTFEFKQNEFQGIDFNEFPDATVNDICAINFPQNLSAIYEPKEYNCSAGTYLPANNDGCETCPANSFCSGGTYTFNETTDQGIQSCASGTFAPTGSSVCYPHIFHVGDDIMYMKSTKQTTPSFNIQIGNDRFYINMTTTRTKMNKDSSHYFHVDWGDNHYYVCDDTTCPIEEQNPQSEG